MSIDNETIQEEELDEQIETVEDSEQDDTTADDDQSLEEWKSKAEKLQAILDDQNRQAFLRRKARQAEKQKAQPLQTNSTQNVEETVLKAQGMTDDELAYLKKVATVNGTSLLDARKDELFTTWKEKEEREQAAQKARLGASKGAGSKSQPVTFNTPGLTPEQHKELWKQRQGN